ncbi:hypothetical protein M0R89_18735 (plasmid) [Halorussus limi]|uniref:Uncharacterized protein n=1 Tax=Halorussus limi TaxID=2938695 RepID=A0A8U0HZX3_9EURY|nr:hypothetical protein [Halorussus limi]UPV76570.1 hypothetical protein M0R89_18735 [Halorussus limi]
MKRTFLVPFVLLVVCSAPLASSVATVTSGASQPQSFAQGNATAYPPGLSADGVTDPLALADAHREALANASYTLATSYAFRRPNGTVLSQGVTTTRVAPGGRPYYAVTSQTQRNATRPLGIARYELATWANETRAVTARQVRGGEPTYREVNRERAPFDPNAQWELLYSAFAATNTTVVERFERDGTTLFRVVSTEQPGPELASLYGGSYSLVAVVDSRGIVRTLQQTYRTTVEGRSTVVSRTVHLTRIGNTTVERPDWYEKAVANGTTNGTR